MQGIIIFAISDLALLSMYKNLLNWLTVVILLPSCSGAKPDIQVVCEENNVGNCIIKWETTPSLKGEVMIYSSNNPSLIPEDKPIAVVPISDEHLTITTDHSKQRSYYLMVFNDKYRIKVATRNTNVPGIQNFRDLGGYKSSETGENVQWGMIYRSGQIENVNKATVQKLEQIGARTFIDLRTKEEYIGFPTLPEPFRTIHIPIATGNMEPVLQAIQKEEIKTDTIYQMVQQMNRELIKKHSKELKELFTILLDPSNYPIVISCTSGKERTGIVSALILAALGANEDVIMEDYRLSNEYFSIPNASKYAFTMPDSAQEAITMLYSAKEDFLNAAKDEIERNYGDVKTYLLKGIGLTQEDINKLRSILLVTN